MGRSDQEYRDLLLFLAELDDAQARIDTLSEEHLRGLLRAAIDYVNRTEDLLFTRRTARITVKPSRTDFMINREAYGLLQEDLAALGHDAVLDPTEERGVGIDPGTLAPLVVYVWIAEEAGRIGRRVLDQLVSEVTTAVIKRLRERPIDHVTVYGPHNEVLAEVNLRAHRRSE